jgi:hypothetical protein
MKKTDGATESQSDRFKRTARELGCDESEERFDAVLKAVAKHRPAGTPSKASKARKGYGRTS